MNTCELLAANARFKQLRREHGAIWTILQEGPAQCFNGEHGVFIESKDKKHSRWVKPHQIKRT